MNRSRLIDKCYFKLLAMNCWCFYEMFVSKTQGSQVGLIRSRESTYAAVFNPRATCRSSPFEFGAIFS
jgi:hypothetical protein